MNLTDVPPREHLPGQRSGGDQRWPGPELVVIRGPGPTKGVALPLDRDLTALGSHPDAEIVLRHGTVSRRHARIRRDGERYVVCDSGSLTGTYVNRLPVDCADLAAGDEIRIGLFRMLFQLPDAL
ncbi:FHA domain-containing protein [Rhodococcus sp. ZPP]|uniref:FHA domain-containing protein n=1 Tax=Rhodococcus sp. ZPP TaxID=2749906 RepID=UPI001AD890FA|nr:FHA domain-containing protein [Rhodococcus sp. ZPP]QTJ65237.1 FHA domain-containing protein [Rhodococcus sp. ZPP]